VEITQF